MTRPVRTPAGAAAAPGLLVTAVAVAAAVAVNAAVPLLSPTTVAVVLGVAVAHVGHRDALAPGLRFVGRTVLRAGVALLGLQLVAGDLLSLGLPVLGVVVATVALTFVGTRWIGTRMGLTRDAATLVAAGSAVCGASAVAAVDGVVDGQEEDVAAAIATVTVYGTAAMLLLPLLAPVLGLSPTTFGLWAGASIQEVAQVVAAAGAVPGAPAVAVVAKLARVALLAPLVTWVSLERRRAGAVAGTRRPPLVPGFVVVFVALAALRSTGVVAGDVLTGASTVATVALTAGLFALGTGVHLPTLRRTGVRPLGLGVVGWVLAAGVSLGGLLLVG